jgi:hypothetical protein
MTLATALVGRIAAIIAATVAMEARPEPAPAAPVRVIAGRIRREAGEPDGR